MSESILQALMQLFAIVAASKAQAEKNNIVETFLRHELSQELVEEYMNIYLQNLNEIKGKQKNDSKRKKVVSASSTKILVICEAINKELVQRQKIIVLVRLLEFISSDFNEEVSEQELEFVKTVAESFFIPEDEYKLLMEFVFHSSTTILDSERVLLIDSDYGFHHERIKHIYCENMSGQIIVFAVKSVNMLLFVFQGEKELMLNGQVLNSNRVHVLSPGSSIRGGKMKPIYYSDIFSTYNYDKTKSRITFEVNRLEYKFNNGTIGLHNMSFLERSGKMVGIMGASGAGKTTLLNVLNGNLKPSSGEIFVNGIDVHNNNGELDGLIGYVSQDDLLIEELTVFQNLYYSAKQCFDNYSRFQLYRTVLKLLKSLGLYEIRNMRVGNPLNKRISGGQRKRLNIALELIRQPSILFLDEPTSGLSSRDSENILDLLKDLTIKGKLVFVVIHQPSSDIFKMFDRLIILDTGGYLIYTGDPVESITYFKSKIRQANWNDSECPTCGNVNPEQIFNIVESRIVDEFGNSTQTRKISPKEWNEYFLKEATKDKKHSILVKHLPEINFKIPGFIKQFGIFVKRDVLAKLSNTQYMLINLLEAPLLAMLLTFIIKYRNISKDNLDGYVFLNNSNLPVYLFMAVIVALFVGLTVSAQEIIKDRKILKREAFLNLNKGAYLLSKVVILLFLSAFQAFTFVIIGNSILEIHDQYFKYWLMLFTVWVNANILGLNISDGFKTTVTIYILIPFLIIPQIILSGVLVSFDKLNPTISTQGKIPLYGEIFTARWAYEGLAVEQFINNAYEKNLYPYEKSMQTALIKRDFWLTILDNKVNAYERNKNNPDRIEDVKSDLLTLQNEIMNEMEDNNSIRPEFNVEDLTIEKMNDATLKLIRSYFEKLRAFYISKFKNACRDKDNYISEQQSTPELKEKYLELKRNFHNESLSDFVTNNRETERVIEYNNHLYQKACPIYLDPRSKILRAHFYAPRKRLGNFYIETYWLNLVVIWGMSIFLYIMLYFGVLRRILNRSERISRDYKDKQEAKIKQKGEEASVTTHKRRRSFQDLSIWR
ncbi:MAG: ATP-binding cassette domain-containing protein [Bacteroidales bacterium]|nr:ATP-binding cassette domain-containing protein [Bacteroidales bacterium]